MSTQIQRRRGTTAEHSTFTGVEGELTVDTTKDTVVVHDGATTGGRPLLREDQANLPSSVTNGISVPSTNTVALSTNGTGRLFIDANGHIGLTASASAWGDSVNGSRAIQIGGSSWYNYRTSIVNFGHGYYYDASDNYRYVYTGVPVSFSQQTSGEHRWFGASSGTAGNSFTPLERMRLDSSGRLGVGTSSPSSTIDVQKSGTNPAISLNRTDAATAGSITLASGNAINYLDNSGTKDFTINTSSIERFRIDSSGRVGIGTSAPNESLHVNGAIRVTSNSSSFNASDGGVFDWVGALGELRVAAARTGANSSKISFITYNSGSLVQAATIDSAGRLGIGTTSPGTFKLNVEGAYNADGLRVFAGASGYGTPLVVGRATGGEALRVDNGGRLLVGTSSARDNFYNGTSGTAPQVQLEGTTFLTSSSSLTCNSTNTLQRSILSLNKSAGSSVGSNSLVSNGEYLGEILFQGNDGTKFIESARIRAVVDGTTGTNDLPTRLEFSTTADGESSPTERMRITSGGTLIVNGGGTVDTNVVFGVQGATSQDAAEIKVRTNGKNAFKFRNSTNVEVGSITINTSATAYNTSSDHRLKENIIPVTDGITRLQQLKPSRFNFIADPDRTVDGFLAHEVQTIVPEAITGEKDAVDDEGNPQYQGIDQSKLVPLLTAALQEAIGRIETLEAEVTALKAS